MSRGTKESRNLEEVEMDEGLVGALSSLQVGQGVAPALGTAASSASEAQEVEPALPAPPADAAPRAPLFIISDHPFCSRREAEGYVFALEQRRLNEPVTAGDPGWPFLSALLARYPRAGAAVQPQPVCPPVHTFVVRRNLGRPANLELHYVDASGMETDFSALKCLRPGFFSVLDTEPGGRRTATEAFLRSTALPIPVQFASHPRTNRKQFLPEDRAFSDAWRTYHQAHARLRLLCQPCVAAMIREQGRAAAAAPAVQEA